MVSRYVEDASRSDVGLNNTTFCSGDTVAPSGRGGFSTKPSIGSPEGTPLTSLRIWMAFLIVSLFDASTAIVWVNPIPINLIAGDTVPISPTFEPPTIKGISPEPSVGPNILGITVRALSITTAPGPVISIRLGPM